MRPIAVSLALALGTALVGRAVAADDCLVTYEQFESTVKHVDLARCPNEEVPTERGFCRLSFQGEKVIVYGFERRGDAYCLASARVHPVETFWK